MISIWTSERIDHAKAVLAETPVGSLQPALDRLSADFEFPISYDSLSNAFRKRGLGALSAHCKQPGPPRPALVRLEGPTPAAPKVEAKAAPGADPELARLFQAAKKGVEFTDLCDTLDCSPKALRAMLDRAAAAGMPLDVDGAGHVTYRAKAPGEERHSVVAPVVGERRVVGVISDTHLGSQYCKRAELREFVHHAYARGARVILHCGDVVDGQYKNHGRFELSHHGLDEQTRDLFETLPQLPGLQYVGTTGNHDETFTKEIGVDVGQFIQQYFQARGRNDVTFYEPRGTYVEVYGAIFHLWHPGKNLAYAKSYHLQRFVEGYDSVSKPNVLLAGHWHTYCHVFTRNVHAIACPTFQGGGSAFARMLGGQPAMGGLVLHWQATDAGVLRDFQVEYRSYHERESPHHVPTHAVG